MAGTVHSRWTNFHENITINNVGIEDCPPAPGATGPQWLGHSAAQVKQIAARAIAQNRPVGVLGAEWSLSPLIGSHTGMVRTHNLSGLWQVQPGDMHASSSLDPAACFYVGGGTRIIDLSKQAEGLGYSISTCGSYMQQSLAGAFATSVNGSRLGYGGIQNMVRGVHFVVSGQQSVWVERAGNPVLSDQTALSFADQVIRDDRIFEGCLVHLGGMGIVNGVVLELEPSKRFSVLRCRRQVGPDWLAALQAGDFRRAAALAGHDAEPAFYEVQLNPYDPWGDEALHLLYFELADGEIGGEEEQPRAQSTYDGISLAYHFDMLTEGGKIPWPGQNPLEDLFSFYSTFFFKPTKGQGPQGSATWGEIHKDPPNSLLHGLVYTSAFAVARSDLVAAVGRTCDALVAAHDQHGIPKALLLTLRFVSGAKGAMAFTRYGETAVLDIEGLKKLPVYGHLPYSEQLGEAVIAALEQAPTIPHCPHWGKLMPPPDWKVEREFGPSADPNSPISLWRAARNTLVPPIAQASMTNQAIADWKL